MNPTRKSRVRCIYFDEAGLGDELVEPITVVAGVLIHADQQLRRIEADTDELIQTLVPAEARRGFESGIKPSFEFHAKDLFSGSKTHPWKKAVRHHIFSEFLKLFEKYRLPIVTGSAIRADIRQMLSRDGRKPQQKILDLASHNFAFNDATRKADFILRHFAPTEVGICFADETLFQRKDWLRTMLSFFRKTSLAGDLNGRMEHLVDTLYFASSHESVGLQLADAASFLVKRHLMAKQDSEPFFQLIESSILLKSEQHES